MRQLLSSHNLKVTKSRKAILEIISLSQLPSSAEDIYAVLLQQGEIFSLSTVYRTLNTLAEKDILIKSTHQDGRVYYQLNSSDHKHYLSCTGCGKIIPIADCPLFELESQVAKATGFSITGHNLELLGVCPSCQNKR